MGCGPFISLASPLIDDSAPRDRKSIYLATLFLCIPVGFAVGYIWAAPIAAALGWRFVFFIEAAGMSPFAALFLLAPNPNDIRGPKQRSNSNSMATSPTGHRPATSILGDFLSLGRNPVVVISMLAIAQLNGGVGGLSFFGPKAARFLYSMNPETADILIGIVTVITGAVGTLCGGIVLDAVGPSVRTALFVCAAGLTASAAATFTAFGIHLGFWPFVGAFGAGEFAMFATAAPANAVLLWSVPNSLRPTALAVTEVLNHALGDVPLPPLMGLLQERLGDWRVTMCVCAGVLAFSGALFGIAMFVLRMQQGRGAGELSIAALEVEPAEPLETLLPLLDEETDVHHRANNAFGSHPINDLFLDEV